jgi:hypothetical protein
VATYLLNFDGETVITGTGLHFHQQSRQAPLYRYGKLFFLLVISIFNARVICMLTISLHTEHDEPALAYRC